jgi:hypothetical protein
MKRAVFVLLFLVTIVAQAPECAARVPPKGGGLLKEAWGLMACQEVDGVVQTTLRDGSFHRVGLALAFDERVRGVRCEENVTFVLTSARLIIVDWQFEEPTQRWGELSSNAPHNLVLVDLREQMSRGIEAWTVSRDAVAIMTGGGTLNVIMRGDESWHSAAFDFDTNVRGVPMTIHKGYLFISVGWKVGVVLWMHLDHESLAFELAELPRPIGDDHVSFFRNGGDLFFGRPDGERFRVVMSEGDEPLGFEDTHMGLAPAREN